MNKHIMSEQVIEHKQHVIVANIRPSNSIIQIHIIRSDSLVACIYDGLYYSAESLPISFTLPHTRSLSYQRLGLPATLST